MPGVSGSPGDFGAIFAQMAARMRALETQQQSIISNLQGQPVISFGLQPGSNPAEYGIGVLNQAIGSTLAFFGEDANGNVGLYFYNSSGVLVLKIDDLGLHQYNSSAQETTRIDSTGVHIYNTSGTEIVTLNSNGLAAGGVTLTSSGLTAGPVTLTSSGLAAGGGVEVNANGLEVYNGSTLELQAGKINASPAIYGLGVRPYGGSALQQVVGFLPVQPPDATNVTSTTWRAFGTPNTVTAEIGPSGQASVTVNVGISTNTAGEQGIVGVSIDGGTAGTYAALASAAGAVSSVVASQIIETGLTPGTHTFELQYQTANDGTSTCSFSGPALIVQPL